MSTDVLVQCTMRNVQCIQCHMKRWLTFDRCCHFYLSVKFNPVYNLSRFSIKVRTVTEHKFKPQRKVAKKVFVELYTFVQMLDVFEKG